MEKQFRSLTSLGREMHAVSSSHDKIYHNIMKAKRLVSTNFKRDLRRGVRQVAQPGCPRREDKSRRWNSSMQDFTYTPEDVPDLLFKTALKTLAWKG